MIVPIVAFVLLMGVIVGGGALIAYRSPGPDARLWKLYPAKRVARLCSTLVDELGPTAAAIAIVLVGVGAMVATIWPLGALAGRLQPAVDEPLFELIRAQFSPQDPWAHINAFVTTMGDPLQTLATTLVAGAIFAVMWWRRRPWVPPLILLATLGIEWYMQMLLGSVIHRGHPPTGTGTFPSGGSARVVAIYGVIFFLMLQTWPAISSRWRVIGWTTIGVLAGIEGYSRLYLLRHWPTDVPGGWVFGALLLLTMIGAGFALVGSRAHTPRQESVMVGSEADAADTQREAPGTLVEKV